MVRIAAHHDSRHPLPSDTDYTPTQAWPEDAYIQWGRYPNGSAFFEVFLDKGPMLRADKSSLAAAEADAHRQYLEATACDHSWGRVRLDADGTVSIAYTNSMGVCRKCGYSNSNVFKPIPKLGEHKEPLNIHQIRAILSSALRPSEASKTRDSAIYRTTYRTIYLKARLFGIELPELPSLPGNVDEFTEQIPDSYRVACREAVAAWLESELCNLHPTTLIQARRSVHSGRQHDARVWSVLHRRDSLRAPVRTLSVDAVAHEDQTGLFITKAGATFRPGSWEDYTGIHDCTFGGIKPGDEVATQLSGVSGHLIITLPDGRVLRWSEDDNH